MCGIAGFFGIGLSAPDAVLQAMGDAIRSRGPDDSGIFQSAEDGIGLVHRRLSIVDLSPAGHQPMQSSCRRYIIVFNGEIYNHPALREQLERAGQAPVWRGHSDTETLLAAIAAWGLRKALESAVGMFALALWDQEKRELSLARDRLGEKPLFYGRVAGGLAFASELKALRVIPGFVGEVNRQALALYMRHNYVPGPFCIYAGIDKLIPGSLVTFNRQHIALGNFPEPERFWFAAAAAKNGLVEPLQFSSADEAADALEQKLRATLRGQMMADVPLGAFLSGGVDSSAIVALMQAEARAGGAPPVKTFTIGFGEDAFDEARYAQAVARHLGTEHSELYVTSHDALAVIPELPAIYDEPFADSSQLPTCLVSRMARQQVTVALSGDGGDELFGGYGRYRMAQRLWAKLAAVPLPLRKALAGMLRSVPVNGWDALCGVAQPLLPAGMRSGFPGDKIHKGAGLLHSANPAELYLNLISHWQPDQVVLGNDPGTGLLQQWPDLPELFEQMMLFDSCSYLPDDILVKVDRAAMNVGLETRVPLLDHRLFEFAWKLPRQMKVRDGEAKWLLRRVLYRHVPCELIERPKMGFAVPLEQWLRGPLRDWAEALLDRSRLSRDGYFDPEPIRRKWAEHLSGQRNWRFLLWDVLMFNAWLDQQ
ncbi:asparagine synthase (glutamine-hydrolyzing) [Methylomonas koyamae]|uniref:asparagine synthase (glutamine-hydrolyzing) n=1 Tax=Methylomonas koyamae TaxID=702114 RepID=A0A291IM86_9GAMM|nr:asparagine synthase (glutamine-hydrolyzing) [Methylomonas koyamae]ATG91306.1 asparagine synthase [Methylomonas koyamae]OAI21710.1 asparagine synthetase B [Methylomonas koyamae]